MAVATREVAVVERFKEESMYGLSAGIRKVADVERWPLLEVRLYLMADNLSQKPIRPSASWAIDSEAMRARGIVVLVKSN